MVDGGGSTPSLHIFTLGFLLFVLELSKTTLTPQSEVGLRPIKEGKSMMKNACQAVVLNVTTNLGSNIVAGWLLT